MIAPIETGVGGTTLVPDARFVLVGLPFSNITDCPFGLDECTGSHTEADECNLVDDLDVDPHGEEHRILALVRKLDRAIDRGDRLAIAVIETILGFGYADRYMREA